jgi:predicted ABC-type ATPase
MSSTRLRLVVVAGPNGAGKSTVAPALLRDLFGIREFVNADAIAKGLSAFDPEAAAIAAGRVMLARMRDLADERADFAFETTLATRSFAPWLSELQRRGYCVALVFVWLPSVDLALARVRSRAASRGHGVPEPTIRRRFERGLANFQRIYRPLADEWLVFDNPEDNAPSLLARGRRDAIDFADAARWKDFEMACDEVREQPEERFVFAHPDDITRAMARGVREALRRHKLLGESIAVWREGCVVIVPAEEIRVDGFDAPFAEAQHSNQRASAPSRATS